MIAPDRPDRLPSVHFLIERLAELEPGFPHALLAREARRHVDQARHLLLTQVAVPNTETILREARIALQRYRQPSLRRVINATGVVLHTNLGRAPLGSGFLAEGYVNLDYDLQTGARARRDRHVAPLLESLFERPTIAVNNGAAAAFLIVNELARGGEVLASRGELIEIGDGFRIPDILERSGAVLREVGTTNRTTVDDYRRAVHGGTKLLLRVHPSNFKVSGFTARPSLPELAALGRETGLPVYEDLGSGNLVDLRPFGVTEPLVSESLAAGANIVSFSADKLLGGPQAGIIAGDAALVERVRRNPLFRALRLDKLIYHALETTLRNLVLENWDAIPALRMIRFTAEQIAQRARNLLPDAELIPGESLIGGGSTPEQSIPTTLIVAAKTHVSRAERELRLGTPPVIARITDDRLVLDLRTVLTEEESTLRDALQRPWAAEEMSQARS